MWGAVSIQYDPALRELPDTLKGKLPSAKQLVEVVRAEMGEELERQI